MNTANRFWQLISFIGVFFCFLVFPLFLADFGFARLFTVMEANQKAKAFADMDSRLELLLQYKSSRHYYHSLFEKINEYADSCADPAAYLAKALQHLKKQYPGCFKFVVWDKNGNTIDSLTDEKQYKYALKTLYQCFSEVDADARDNYPGNPAAIEYISDKISVLKGYLGDFLLPSNLNHPYLRLNLGEIITSSADKNKTHFWFKACKKHVFFVQIPDSVITSEDYLKKMVRAMNRSSETSIITGIAEVVSKNYVYTGEDHSRDDELLIELKKIQNFSDSRLEAENYLILGKIAVNGLLGFCYVPKNNVVINALEYTKKAQIAALVLLCIAFLLLFYFYYRTSLLSIKLKLAILFIYANGLPLMILGFIGYEYLQQTKIQMTNKAQEEISEFLADFDSHYPAFLCGISDRLNKGIARLNEKYHGKYVDLNNETEFLEEFKQTNPEFLVSCDEEGKLNPKKFLQKKFSKILTDMSVNILKYFNLKNYTPTELFDHKASGKRTGSVEHFFGGKKIFIGDILRRFNVIRHEQVGMEGNLYYWNIFGDYNTGDFTQVFLAAWDSLMLQSRYVSENIDEANKNYHGITLYSLVAQNGVLYPKSGQVPDEIIPLLNLLKNTKVVKENSIMINGEEYAVYGAVGHSLHETSIIGLRPLKAINQHIADMSIVLAVFAFLSLTITAVIGLFLSAYFMGPVKEIENGVTAIGERNFSYRLTDISENEFGHLATVLNGAISSLEELMVAQTVQKNLFPQEPLKKNALEVFGKSVAMNSLGGDYYDFFPLTDTKIGVLMGDVAGHGVPAGLLMAMAKASVLLADKEKLVPSELLYRLHDVIYKVKSRRIKRMMTCQYFVMDSLTGACSFANAGHCYPAVARENGGRVEYITADGTPLGITKKANHKDIDFNLLPGDIMVLYTDGIIEALNSHEEPFGYNRFEEAVKTAYSKDLGTFYSGLFSIYQNWTASVDDDLTMVLVKFLPLETGKP